MIAFPPERRRSVARYSVPSGSGSAGTKANDGSGNLGTNSLRSALNASAEPGCFARRLQCESRQPAEFFAKQLQRSSFGASHHALFGRLQIIVTREVEPPVNEIKGQLFREVPAVLLRIRLSGINRNTDFTSDSGCVISFEGNDVGSRRISQEIGVQLRQSGVCEENKGQLAGWTSRQEVGPVPVQDRDQLRYITPFDAQTRMAIGDGDAPSCH